ncbi:hypothetical protein V2H45_11995 [Tumidithrix elongata RA019]|uniref:Uncharacterized protein n=1 Tax=Tumidithrix elongata BACA0141 TaxID=2716417 RepID=A0AAW9Q219_9CYAN|nr:hypothetical protein [Tumidithrix elongata RA019]
MGIVVLVSPITIQSDRIDNRTKSTNAIKELRYPRPIAVAPAQLFVWLDLHT